MDYIARAVITTCNNHKFKIFTSKQCLFGTLLMLFLATNGWAFETNVDSKVTANFAVTGALDVTGALKAGSVDASSSAIATSIADTNNDTTIPTTKAVLDYVNAQVSGSSSSGGNTIQISQPKNALGSVQVALEYCVGLEEDGGGWRLPTVDEFLNACSRDATCRTEGTDGVLYRTATPVIPISTGTWPDFVIVNYWKLDAVPGTYEAADIRCVK